MTRKRKVDDWLDQEYNAKQDKLPTLRQYLKELPKDVSDIVSTVRVIWRPGKWDNYTLQTDDFRIIVQSTHKLYRQLHDRIDTFTKGTETLDVCVTNREQVSYRLRVNPQERGEWFFIAGDSGLKFTSETPNAEPTDDREF